jgi:hypothetical protein
MANPKPRLVVVIVKWLKATRFTLMPVGSKREYRGFSRAAIFAAMALLASSLALVFMPDRDVFKLKSILAIGVSVGSTALLVYTWSYSYRKRREGNPTLVQEMEMSVDLASVSFGDRLFWLYGRDVFPMRWQGDKPTPHFEEYRGFLSYFRSILENFVAVYAFVWIVLEGTVVVTRGYYDGTLGCFRQIFFVEGVQANADKAILLVAWVSEVLQGAFILLVIDTVIQIAVLIESPGATEVIDVLNVAITAFVVIVLSGAVGRAAQTTPAELGCTALYAGVAVALLLGVRAASRWVRAKAEEVEERTRCPRPPDVP